MPEVKRTTPSKCPKTKGLGKTMKERSRVSAFRAVVVMAATSAPKRFVKAATHETPQNPHAAKMTMTLVLETKL